MGKYQIAPTTQFKKDLKKYLNRNRERQAISEAIDLLAAKGNKGYRKRYQWNGIAFFGRRSNLFWAGSVAGMCNVDGVIIVLIVSRL